MAEYTNEQLRKALDESLKLQSHYARLQNQYDGGARVGFNSADEWIARLFETGALPQPDATPIAKWPQDSPWLIWSIEHFAWWAPGESGYVNYRAQAGRYTFERAIEIVRNANLYRRQQPPNEAMVLAED